MLSSIYSPVHTRNFLLKVAFESNFSMCMCSLSKVKLSEVDFRIKSDFRKILSSVKGALHLVQGRNRYSWHGCSLLVRYAEWRHISCGCSSTDAQSIPWLSRRRSSHSSSSSSSIATRHDADNDQYDSSVVRPHALVANSAHLRVNSRGGHVCFSESVVVVGGGGSDSVATATTLVGKRAVEHLLMKTDTAATHRRRPVTTTTSSGVLLLAAWMRSTESRPAKSKVIYDKLYDSFWADRRRKQPEHLSKRFFAYIMWTVQFYWESQQEQFW